MNTVKTRPDETDSDKLVDVPSHKVAAGAGALVGGIATGATIGTMAGPVGTAIGAVAGAIAGGLGADALANSIDQAREDAHWRENYRSRPYVAPDAPYEEFAPAYQYGIVSYTRYPDRDFDDVSAELSEEWATARGESTLEWEHAGPAARDAWDRLAASRAERGRNR